MKRLPKQSLEARPGHVPRDIGIGDGSKLRAMAGLRFAQYSDKTNVLGSAQKYAVNFFTKQQFDGIGPRIGFSYRRPVLGVIEVVGEGAAAGLWGRFKTNINDTLNGGGAYSIVGGESHNGWVGNLEGSIALAYAPYGPRGWDVSLGIRGEAWFSQIDTNAFNAASTSNHATPQAPVAVSGQREDRFNWGPFLRVKVPLAISAERRLLQTKSVCSLFERNPFHSSSSRNGTASAVRSPRPICSIAAIMRPLRPRI
jgi:hypothetical protein